ncbi:hypothetical protein CQA49_06660 [Helicobacter sp. MIT 00-7814]|uniref:hypothetical protein n=1 Tax=unclassified Helicobacter TaxID=2593540 RepID=UPI000E1EF726|nr:MULTISPECIES: hypothetical protein [unclassified Helicobacter]RDU53324.1 hypothetical protein CQA49_06660 [Helicobacter sp. MIT 00-7814]RDU54145.1 hypothetical protein CQA37_05900 [Helicobacter sp. MIT 99-10781]
MKKLKEIKERILERLQKAYLNLKPVCNLISMIAKAFVFLAAGYIVYLAVSIFVAEHSRYFVLKNVFPNETAIYCNGKIVAKIDNSWNYRTNPRETKDSVAFTIIKEGSTPDNIELEEIVCEFEK